MSERAKISGGDVDIDILRSDEELTHDEIGDNCANLSAVLFQLSQDIGQRVFDIPDEKIRYEAVIIVLGVQDGQIVATEGKFAEHAPRQILGRVLENFAARVKHPGMHDGQETIN